VIVSTAVTAVIETARATESTAANAVTAPIATDAHAQRNALTSRAAFRRINADARSAIVAR
jgi:hypothetical protein